MNKSSWPMVQDGSPDRLFEGFTWEETQAVVEFLDGHVIQFERGEHIGKAVSVHMPHTLAYLLSGGAFMAKYDAQGNQSILDIVTPGYLISYCDGRSNSDIHNLDTVVTAKAEVLGLDVRKLWLAEDEAMRPLLTKFSRNVACLLAERNQRLLEKLDIISGHTLREKVLAFLNAQRRSYRRDTFDIPLNRQEIADYLYTNRSALSRELGLLREQGLVEFHKSHFTLLFPAE